MTTQRKSAIIGIAIVLLGVMAFTYVMKGQTPSRQQIQIENTPTTAQQSIYSLADVAKHAIRNDCWLAIDSKVYDVTSFISEHPGGDRILEGCGKDATSLFQSIGEHMPKALEYLPAYFIGNLQ